MSDQLRETDETYAVEPKALLSAIPERPTLVGSETSSTAPPSYRSLALHDSQVDVDAYPTEDGLLVVDVENGASKIVSALAAELCFPDGEEATSLHEPSRPAPPLNVVIQIVGSRGDVQPFVALGQVLKATYGHRVRIATHPTFKKFVEDHGLEFFSITGDPAQMMDFMVKNPGLMPKFKTVREGEIGRRRKAIFEIIEACWRSCIEPSDSPSDIAQENDTTSKPFIADAIIANPPSFAHIHCAEKLGIPIHMMFTMPWSPTRAFPHPLAQVKSPETQKKDSVILSYTMVEMMTWQGLGDIINRFRVRTLGLDPLTLLSASNYATRLKVPFTYCWSPAFIPKPKEWGAHIDISGFFFLSASSSYIPDAPLAAFLESGPPPVYIGFGSIVVDDPTAMTNLIFEAVKKTGLRALVSKGWGGLGANEIGKPENVFMLGNVPHDWLFQHVSCVVHHGGAGTTSAGIATGKPTVVVPFFGDQMYWGSMIHRKGAGPAPIPYKDLTADSLADAILKALEPDVVAKAQELGSHIQKERGNELGAQSFNDKLHPDDLRCSLTSNRVAVWKLKNPNLRLSALAAAILAEKELINTEDLELFRPREWKVESGPQTPLAGITNAAIDTIGGILKGVGDYPVELMRATGLHQSATHNKTTTADFALDPGKGVSRMMGTTLRAPADFAYGIAEGFNNMPKLYGDDTVRETGKITGLGSGLSAAGKGFGYGLWDGVTGIFTQPVKGIQKEGLPGLWKGFAKGIGGAAFKPAAGAAGLIGYTGKGIYKTFQKEHVTSIIEYVTTARIADGFLDLQGAATEEREAILNAWEKVVKVDVVDVKAMKKWKDKGKGKAKGEKSKNGKGGKT